MSDYQNDAVYQAVKKLITTPEIKDGAYIDDWIAEGDLFNMSMQQIADEWDALPMMETDED